MLMNSVQVTWCANFASLGFSIATTLTIMVKVLRKLTSPLQMGPDYMQQD